MEEDEELEEDEEVEEGTGSLGSYRNDYKLCGQICVYLCNLCNLCSIEEESSEVSGSYRNEV